LSTSEARWPGVETGRESCGRPVQRSLRWFIEVSEVRVSMNRSAPISLTYIALTGDPTKLIVSDPIFMDASFLAVASSRLSVSSSSSRSLSSSLRWLVRTSSSSSRSVNGEVAHRRLA